MSIIAWIILGAIAGWIASLITRSGEGIVGDIIIGILGAVIGGWVMEAAGGSGVNGINFYSILVAIVGAVILLGIVNFFRRGRASAIR